MLDLYRGKKPLDNKYIHVRSVSWHDNDLIFDIDPALLPSWIPSNSRIFLETLVQDKVVQTSPCTVVNNPQAGIVCIANILDICNTFDPSVLVNIKFRLSFSRGLYTPRTRTFKRSHASKGCMYSFSTGFCIGNNAVAVPDETDTLEFVLRLIGTQADTAQSEFGYVKKGRSFNNNILLSAVPFGGQTVFLAANSLKFSDDSVIIDVDANNQARAKCRLRNMSYSFSLEHAGDLKDIIHLAQDKLVQSKMFDAQTPWQEIPQTEAGFTKQLSIIIPVYNAMPYLQECLESIVSQSYNESDVEVILVDDGSTDGSQTFCDTVAMEHNYIYAIHQLASGGPSRPRNRGTQFAHGKYVMYCDADDKFLPNSIDKLISYSKALNYDIGLFEIDASEWNPRRYGVLFDQPLQENCTIDTQDIIKHFGSYKMILKELLTRNNIKYIEGINPEDWAFSVECYLVSKNICVIADQAYYWYRKRETGSLSQVDIDLGDLQDWNRRIDAYTTYIEAAQKHGDINAHPVIMARLCEIMVARNVELAVKTDFKEYALTTLRNLIGQNHYTDAVRGLMPFSKLVVLDALVDNIPTDDLSRIVNLQSSDARISFDYQGANTASTYTITLNGNNILSKAMPHSLGQKLSEPAYRYTVLSKLAIQQDGLSVSGLTFALRAENNDFVNACLLLKVYESDAFLLVPLESTIDIGQAYAGVSYVSIDWTVFVPWKALRDIDPGAKQKLRFDLYLELSCKQTTDQMRLGRFILPQAEGLFETTIVGPDFSVTGFYTDYGNASIRINS